jgi:integrase
LILSVMTGIRPEEPRALRWDHVDLDGATIHVWRSTRAHGDVKTVKSRRTLEIAPQAVGALRRRQAQQECDREAARQLWHETGLVFTTSVGTEMDSHNIRRSMRRLTKAAGLGESWTPRELRHTFVSIASEAGVPIEEIAALAGHSTTRTTELVYRKELRPVLRTGAAVMGELLAAGQ